MHRALMASASALALLASPPEAGAISTLFNGQGILYSGNIPDRNGCCGSITFNISFNNIGPYGAVLVSNYWRTFIVYLDPTWVNPDGVGTFNVSIALADWVAASSGRTSAATNSSQPVPHSGHPASETSTRSP